MIPDGCNTPNEDPPNQTPLANVSTQSPTATKTVLPSAESSVLSKSYPMTHPSDVPPRPSTAPPHPSTDPPTDLQTRTTLVSHLRARNLLLQKAISHIDDAVLSLMAARSGIPSSKIQQVRGEARNRKDLLDRVDRAIKMAQNGELHENSLGGDTRGEARSGTGGERYATNSSFGQRKTMFNRFMKGRPQYPGPLIQFKPECFLEQLRPFLIHPRTLPWMRLNSADHPRSPSWVLPRGSHKSPQRCTRFPNSSIVGKFFKSRLSPGKNSLQIYAPLDPTLRLKRSLRLPLMLYRLKHPRRRLHLLKSLPGQPSTNEHSLR